MVHSWNTPAVICRAVCISLIGKLYVAAAAAQAYTCSTGAISHVTCFSDDLAYLSDIRYTSNPYKAVTSCQSTEQQLSSTAPSDFAISVGEYITALTVCSDSAGVRGIAAATSLGHTYSCGLTTAGCITQQGGQALGGFATNCASNSRGLQRVLSIEAPCWIPNFTLPTTPNTCPPGQGSPGGGLPCKPCLTGEYGDGDSGMCLPCPPGSITLEDGQSSCGCLPGYGTTNSSLNECSECPAGTYSTGGSMSPCTTCPAGFESDPGSPSLRFCVCQAGSGYTASACKSCARGYYSPGPHKQGLAGTAARAAVINTTYSARHVSPGMVALQSAILEAQEFATEPTHSKCVSCGTRYTTASTGASSKSDCIPGTPDTCEGTGKELLDDVCVCSAGYEPADDGSCTPCDSTSYKEDPGDAACQRCGSGLVPNRDKTACVKPGTSPSPPAQSPRVPSSPSPSPPPPAAGECSNNCVECDIDGLIEEISFSCGDDPENLVFADSYCIASNTDAPSFSTNPASVLESAFGSLTCAEIVKVTRFTITVTDVGNCRTQPLTCTVTGYEV